MIDSFSDSEKRRCPVALREKMEKTARRKGEIDESISSDFTASDWIILLGISSVAVLLTWLAFLLI